MGDLRILKEQQNMQTIRVFHRLEPLFTQRRRIFKNPHLIISSPTVAVTYYKQLSKER